MGKKDKNNSSEISESGVLSLDMDDFQTAVTRSTWKNTGSGSVPDVGDYPCTIVSLERGESAGNQTSGAPKFTTKLEIDGGPFGGSTLNIFTIAHASTAQRYMRFVYGVLGKTADDIPMVNGRPQIPLPTEKELQQYVGKSGVIVNVQHRKRTDATNADGSAKIGTDNDFVVPEAGAEPVKSGKVKKAKASKIAE